MALDNCFSDQISVFLERQAPEVGVPAGYGCIIHTYNLQVPVPDQIALIVNKQSNYSTPEWRVFEYRYLPDPHLYKQLVFALKYEGVNLLILKKLFEQLTVDELTELVTIEPMGQYSRRLWFFYEWLTGHKLPLDDLKTGSYTSAVDEKLQYAIPKGIRMQRQRIMNNLPGVPAFCPLIRKTERLQNWIASDLAAQKGEYLKGLKKNVIQRASALLLLKDSKASFTIEGESPKNQRTARWGRAIGQAGMKPLSTDELVRLQQIVIENARFMEMGFRKEEGFIGEHDRYTAEPIPDHISARWKDLDSLVDGLLETNGILIEQDYDAILAATTIAFGFVFIHPFVDGNGRVHRYLIHHVIAKKKFAQQGVIFPVSAVMLDRMDDYREVLESYSHPVIQFIEWEPTDRNNVRVLNETADYYRYFDATRQAEFLYECVAETINVTIPEEVDYIQKFDAFKRYIDNHYSMPDKEVSLLVVFLEQNDGVLAKNRRENEFEALTDEEVTEIQSKFQEIFLEE